MAACLHLFSSALVLYSLLCTSVRTTQASELHSVYLYVVMVTVDLCESGETSGFSKNEFKNK